MQAGNTVEDEVEICEHKLSLLVRREEMTRGRLIEVNVEREGASTRRVLLEVSCDSRMGDICTPSSFGR